MSTSTGQTIEEHGTPIDVEKKRIQCKYCSKEVNGFNRLKHHLAAVGNDVTACTEVPAAVKAGMKDLLLEKRKERFMKEVGRIEHPELPLKRNFSPSSEQRRCQTKLTTPTNSGEGSIGIGNSAQGSSKLKIPFPRQPIPKAMNNLDFQIADSINGSHTSIPVIENIQPIVKEEAKDEITLHAARCIGRFFFDAGIDTTNINLPSFQAMINAVIGCGSGYKTPGLDELKGVILHHELKEVVEHVEHVKRSWGRTGCSILLDGWTDQRGRSFVSFLVSCPAGTIFLRSVDASDAVEDAGALSSLISDVIEEVGVENVVQVVAHESSALIEEAGKRIMERYRSIFWTLCAEYCINMILQKIQMLDSVKKVLDDAKAISRFIHSNPLTLSHLRTYIGAGSLVRMSNLKSVIPFITLKNMLSHREILVSLFNSPEWNASDLASKWRGKCISKMVKDSSFWAAVDEVLKATTPLLGILDEISRKDTSPMGVLYNSLDCAKEEIKENLGGEEARYSLYWALVDDVWNNYLHSPLHSAGYYLNPMLFYSSDFYLDAEVTTGVVYCMVKMSKDPEEQEQMVIQLDKYRQAEGEFSGEEAVDGREKVSPDVWWSAHGGRCAELQRIAVKILSQTCSGASRYMLKKAISEKMHAEVRDVTEQQRFRDLEFVHYNRHLWHPLPTCPELEFYPADETMNEWIVDNN